MIGNPYPVPGVPLTASADSFSLLVTGALDQLVDLCQSCRQATPPPYSLLVTPRGLAGKYRCSCAAEWSCWWASCMAPEIAGLAGECCERVLPYEIELGHGRARADWECAGCGRLWSRSEQVSGLDGGPS